MEEYVYIIICPLAFCVLDIVTGYVAAMRNGTLNSSVMRNGLWSKSAEVLAVLVSIFVQFGIKIYGASFLNVELDIPIITAICAYISLYELTSIVENIGKMNQAIGEKLIELFGIDPAKVGLVRVTETEKDKEGE